MKNMREARRRGRSESGAELLEFALALPLLLLLLVGIFDFGSMFALRQRMTNAARQCARIVVSSPLTNQNCQSAVPCSIEDAAGAVVQYMAGAGAGVPCIQPGTPTTAGATEWTYSCANGTSLVINRGYTISGRCGARIPATRVTFIYPIHWWLTQLLPGYSKYATMTTEFTMQNLVS